MEKLLKLNPQYLISIGFILMCVGGVFFDVTSDIGLGIMLFGGLINLLGCIIGFIQIKKNKKTPTKKVN